MKSLQFLAAAFMFLALASTPLLAGKPSADDLQAMLTQGQTAYLRGDLALAKKSFAIALQVDPRNQLATVYLQRIQAEETRLGANAGGLQQQRLEKLILPKVEMRDATLGSALDYLKKAAARQSNDQIIVNFVAQIPDEQLRTQTVTLAVQNIPFTEVLRYISGLAGVNFTYQKYAILMTRDPNAPLPVSAVSAVTPAATNTPPEAK